MVQIIIIIINLKLQPFYMDSKDDECIYFMRKLRNTQQIYINLLNRAPTVCVIETHKIS